MGNKVVVLYIRLSKMDDKAELNGESDSVSNQRVMLHQFLDKHPDLANYPRYEAVDDGFTGTNDKRPKLQEVLRMAENGEVQAICVKDNSRFFRNYIKAGEYLDIKFPMWGVRFLSVTDGYDSENYKGMTSDMEQALKNILHASVPKMLSQATITAKISLMKQGKFVGGYAPYGYRLDPSVQHTLFVDEEAANVVRYIYDLALEGKTTSEIAYQLNSKKIVTPSQYFRRNHPESKKFSHSSEKIQWSYTAVRNILTKYVYTGAMVSYRNKTAELGSRKIVKNEPIIVENTHEAIVSIEKYNDVQKILKKGTKNPVRKNNEYPLKSYVLCGNCKRAMGRQSRGNITYKCSNNYGKFESGCIDELRFPEAKLEEIVLSAIRDYVGDIEKIFFRPQPVKVPIKTKSIESLEQDIKNLQKRKLQGYEKYSQGVWSKEEFLTKKSKLDNDIASVENLILEKQEELEAPTICAVEDKDVSVEKLTSELVKQYVKAVYIHDLDKVEVEFLQ